LKQCNSAKAYDFYESKYKNFIDHVKKISIYYAEIQSWYHKLEGVNFDVFINIVESTIMNGSPKQIIDNFAEEEGFDTRNVSPNDLDKLERYIMLFKIMLE
jgi:hypothetical protein